jgi:hypothetical protein
MAIATNHEPTNEWHHIAYKTWRFIVHRLDAYHDDRVLVAYDSHVGAWRIFINDHDAGQAYDLDEAKALSAMLYKLHPEWQSTRTIYRSTPNKPPNF